MARKGLMDGGGISLRDLDEGNMTAGEASQPAEPQPPQEPETPPEPPQEPQEPPAEPQEPEVPQEPQEPVAPQEPQTPADQIQQSGLNLGFLNTLLETKFESEDQVKDAFNKPTMESEYDELKVKHDELASKNNDLSEKYDLLAEQIDPANYFSSEDAMKLEAFKKTNPKKDAAIASKIFSTEDLNTVSDLEMVKMGYKFNTPKLKGTDKDLEATISEEFNVDPETPFNEWPVTAQNRLAVKAGELRDQFESIKGQVSLPERVNIEEVVSQRKQETEQRIANLTQEWDKNAEEVLSSSQELKVPIGKPKDGEEQQFFKWDLGAPPKEEVDRLKADYIKLGMDVNDDSKASFSKALEYSLLDKHLPLMMQKYGEDLLAAQKEAHLEETHNPDPIKDTQRPEEGGDDKLKKERSAFVMGGAGTSIPQQPLFKQD
jgi:hypothetical protein